MTLFLFLLLMLVLKRNKPRKYYFLFLIFIYVFIWLHLLLVVAHSIFGCGMQDLVPWLGIEPWFPALGARSLNHWTTREVPLLLSVTTSEVVPPKISKILSLMLLWGGSVLKERPLVWEFQWVLELEWDKSFNLLGISLLICCITWNDPLSNFVQIYITYTGGEANLGFFFSDYKNTVVLIHGIELYKICGKK